MNPGPPRYQADMLPIELSWLGSKHKSVSNKNQVKQNSVQFKKPTHENNVLVKTHGSTVHLNFKAVFGLFIHLSDVLITQSYRKA